MWQADLYKKLTSSGVALLKAVQNARVDSKWEIQPKPALLCVSQHVLFFGARLLLSDLLASLRKNERYWYFQVESFLRGNYSSD